MLQVRSAGAVTALGLDAHTTVASLRAGLDGFVRVPHKGATGQPLQAAPIATFAQGVGGIDRYVAFATHAIAQCRAQVEPRSGQRMRLLVGLPASGRPGVPVNLGPELRLHLAAATGLAPGHVIVLEQGRVAVAAGLAMAQRLIGAGEAERCIVGGVDVLTNGDSLRGLSVAGFLKEEWDGFIAGEAAAFLCLEAPAPGHGWLRHDPALLLGLGLAREPADGSAANPWVGRAVADAIRRAMTQAALPDTAVSVHINDISGSRCDFEDNAMGLTRYFRTPEHAYETWHVASYLGETGAAVGAIQLIWAQAMLDLELSGAAGALLTASAHPIRAAALLYAPRRATSVGARMRMSVGWPCMHDAPAPHSGEAPARPQFGVRALHDDLIGRHFEELTWLWTARAAHLHDVDAAWTSIKGYESRLLAHLDALVWMGDPASAALQKASRSDAAPDLDAALLVQLARPVAWERIQTWIEWGVAQPARLAALGRVLGLQHPQARDSLVGALGLRPERTSQLAALSAMTVSGVPNAHVLSHGLNSGDSEVAVAALHASARTGQSQLLGMAIRRLQSMQAAGAPPLGGSTLAALLTLGASAIDVPGLDTANLARTAPLVLALQCLRDGVSLGALLPRQPPDAQAIQALGWAGELSALELLLSALADGDPARAAAAATALHRITGLAPQVRPPSGETADQPGYQKPLLSVNREDWCRVLEDASIRSQGSYRLRHGRPWSGRAAHDLLQDPLSRVGDRAVAVWEDAVVNRRAPVVHPNQFVASQRHALESASASARQGSEP